MNQNITLPLSETVSLEMIFVQGTGNGTFTMGGGGMDNPYCEVAVADFWIGKYPLTQAQWDAVKGIEKPNPCFFKDKNRPVENIPWYRAQSFVNTINKKMIDEAILIDKKFYLLTEAQWEYAARGGVHWRNNFKYAGSNILSEVGWYANNSENETKPVGGKLPNQLGIYDMSGNVWEWCLSKYMPYPYDEENERNRQTQDHNERVLRGGSWGSHADKCTCTLRTSGDLRFKSNSRGIRLCLLPV